MKICVRRRPCALGEESGLNLEELGPADGVYGPEAGQQEVLQAILEPQLERFLSDCGCNAVFLAYGQTGSGKTHTILGPPGVLTEQDYKSGGSQSWGFFPYAAVATLSSLQQRGLAKRAQLKVSVVEVYLEKVFDLLNERQHVAVPGASVRASSTRVDNNETKYDANGKWQPPGKWLGEKTLANIQARAKEVVLGSALDVVHVARLVEATRAAQSHALNHRSSRSHCMITLSLRQVDQAGQLQQKQLVFVDLAGSERVGKSGVVADGTGGAQAFHLPGRVTVDIPGTRFDEARSVNCSLSALGRVIAAQARRDRYVSYRDSALTQLLKEALQGHAQVTVLLALRSERTNDSETLSTLRFGAVCRAAGQVRAAEAPKRPARQALKQLRQELQRVAVEVERLVAEGQEEHLNEGFAHSTVQGFLENKAKMEAAQRQVTALKNQLLERQSELRLAGQQGDKRLEEMQAELARAQQVVLVASGIFYRQALERTRSY